MSHAERWAATIGLPAHAIDEQTAIVVDHGSARVVFAGQWRHFEGRVTSASSDAGTR